MDYLDESTIDDDLCELAEMLAPKRCIDIPTKARTKRVERRLGIEVPPTHKADLHMAVMYCHEELERRRNDEQRFSGFDSEGNSHTHSPRAHGYKRSESTNPYEPTFGFQRERACGYRAIGVDSDATRFRFDHAAIGDRSIWLGFHAEDY